MNNIPFFTTQFGVASLTLDQIPFNHIAYIRIHSSESQALLLAECLDFCKAVGAEQVYVTGADLPDHNRATVSVIRMKRERKGLPASDLIAVEVDPSNRYQFLRSYQEKMYPISHSAGLKETDIDELIKEKSGYLLYCRQELLGIGIAQGAWIRSIIALRPGAGESILLALNQKLSGDEVHVELVDSNKRALRLYERLGFERYETVSTWYKIL
jgi:hypothetical protein